MPIIFNSNPIRIDQYLTSQFPYSRAFFHHIIERGGVSVNGQAVKKSFKLKKGDEISIDSLERYLTPEILEEAPDIDIPIILDQPNYLIINKPKGVLSHPNSLRDVQSPSVVGRLYHHFKNLPSFSSFIRAGLVHRLDKDTNGLMIIAKTEVGLSHFKRLFSEKSESLSIKEKESVNLQKFYYASCQITPKGSDFLKKAKKSGLPYYIQSVVHAKVPHFMPKMGITKIESITPLSLQKQDKKFIQLSLQILTGRTHQIRYHLAYVGLPILGDYIYGVENGEPMQLTAYKLIFEDINGKTKEVHI